SAALLAHLSRSACTAGCPSGQWKRTVNPSAYAYAGSNPAPATGWNVNPAPGPHFEWGFRVSTAKTAVRRVRNDGSRSASGLIVGLNIGNLRLLTQVAPGAPRSRSQVPSERAERLGAASRRPTYLGQPGVTWGVGHAGRSARWWARLAIPEPFGRSLRMSQTTQRTTPEAVPPLTTNTMLSVAQIMVVRNTKDRKTVTKQISGGRYPNAVQEDHGLKAWWVPVKDLVTAGDLEAAQVVEVAAGLESAREAKQVGDLRARIVGLEKDLAAQTARAEERQALITTLQAVVSGLLPALASFSMTTGVSQ
ncbi:MAG: hypothetical protein JWQ74_3629, partial [Marmoricola sp.]|nr:hypothetical protein [Marmoricola sp.]